MFTLRRKAVQSADRLGAVATRSTRRYASGKTGDEVHHFAGTSKEHGHQHAGPAEESLGTQFYFVLALVPASIALYAASTPSADGTQPAFSRLIESYSAYKKEWAEKAAQTNTLHTQMAEQAAFDRNLFQSTPGSPHYELKFPEIFNTGSPYNGVAGHRARNMDEVVAHYHKLNADAEIKKLKALEQERSS
ncbi:NADH-ubiquinone oxidoreductase 17.8 kDa subunit [Phlyctema vagabunda]|uniref:NADH-ubiquinone oxidoreductase 17.8 kDa subunit n=1 Tax=Phlyctema vagabunda TaxID=108571 RepID=A0ABR4P2P8_9HELO